MININIVETIDRAEGQIRNHDRVFEETGKQLVIIAKAYLKTQQPINKVNAKRACIHEVGCFAMETGCCALSHCPNFVEKR